MIDMDDKLNTMYLISNNYLLYCATNGGEYNEYGRLYRTIRMTI